MNHIKPVTTSPRGKQDALGAFIGNKAEIDERLARPSLGGVRRSFTRGERLKAFVRLAPLFFCFL